MTTVCNWRHRFYLAAAATILHCEKKILMKPIIKSSISVYKTGCINSGFSFFVVWVYSSAGSRESGISIIKGGKYIPAAGVVLIISGKPDVTSSSNKKAMVIVGAVSSEGKKVTKLLFD